jgi:hypothetical protein
MEIEIDFPFLHRHNIAGKRQDSLDVWEQEFSLTGF